jgi:hypothetical protein
MADDDLEGRQFNLGHMLTRLTNAAHSKLDSINNQELWKDCRQVGRMAVRGLGNLVRRCIDKLKDNEGHE